MIAIYIVLSSPNEINYYYSMCIPVTTQELACLKNYLEISKRIVTIKSKHAVKLEFRTLSNPYLLCGVKRERFSICSHSEFSVMSDKSECSSLIINHLLFFVYYSNCSDGLVLDVSTTGSDLNICTEYFHTNVDNTLWHINKATKEMNK